MWLKLCPLLVPKTLFNTKKPLGSASIITAIRNSSNVEERKVNANGLNINYVETGTGPHPVLLLSGALGSAWTDFKPQIENLEKSELTIIASLRDMASRTEHFLKTFSNRMPASPTIS